MMAVPKIEKFSGTITSALRYSTVFKQEEMLGIFTFLSGTVGTLIVHLKRE
jgi:hypothetical protein